MSAINSDKTGTLTMNQMTAVELVDLTDRYDHWQRLRPRWSDQPRSRDLERASKVRFFRTSWPATRNSSTGKVVGDPHRGALLVLGHKAGLDIEQTREKFPRLATLPFDPSYKLMATFHPAVDDSGKKLWFAAFVKGAAPAVMSHATSVIAGGTSTAINDDVSKKAQAEVARKGRWASESWRSDARHRRRRFRSRR